MDDIQPEASTSRKYQQKPSRHERSGSNEDKRKLVGIKDDDDGNQSLSDTGSKSGGKRVEQRKKGKDNSQGYDRRRINKKLRLLRGPLLDIPPIKTEASKFSANNQLYIGNLADDVEGEELAEMFMPYGDVGEVVMNTDNPKNIYALLRMDYYANAVHANRVMQDLMLRDRLMVVRLAPYASTIRVRNLTPWVSNELLHKAFEVFGPVERALVYVDERGKPTGEGMVEFKTETGAKVALRYCTKKCFFLSASLRPVIVELHAQQNDPDGLPEKKINKDVPEFRKERQKGPHFADPDSFEHQYGQRWKQMYELYKEKAEALKRELTMEEQKLEAQMEFARFEHETEQIREQLRKREQGREQHKIDLELKERMASAMSEIEQMQNRIKHTYETLHRYSQERKIFLEDPEKGNESDIRRPSQAVTQGDTGGGISTLGRWNLGEVDRKKGNEKNIRQTLETEKQGYSGGDRGSQSSHSYGKMDREKGNESDKRRSFDAAKQGGRGGGKASYGSHSFGERDRKRGNESDNRRPFEEPKQAASSSGIASFGSARFGEMGRIKGNERDIFRPLEADKPSGSSSGTARLSSYSYGEVDRKRSNKGDNRRPFEETKGSGSGQVSFGSDRFGEVDRTKGNERESSRPLEADKAGSSSGKDRLSSYSYAEMVRKKGNVSDNRRPFEAVTHGGTGSWKASFGEKDRKKGNESDNRRPFQMAKEGYRDLRKASGTQSILPVIPKHDPGHNKPSYSRVNEPHQSGQKRDWDKQQHRSFASGSRHDWSNKDPKYDDASQRKRSRFENPKTPGWFEERKAKRKREWD